MIKWLFLGVLSSCYNLISKKLPDFSYKFVFGSKVVGLYDKKY